ncbi:MAG: hypothetical protein JO153_12115 [Solirubrobacterales bacterium]|nr:hypothetical protein [Solirubrobacterales bacterium]MBV9917237.1 hypothetical protein [Solirubrobacterales bacterium]
MTTRRWLSLTVLVLIACLSIPALAQARVLLVGRYHAVQGRYRTIQSAVNAAKPGDWILVAPGDYKESTGKHDGVQITTPRLHLRGMDRNRVIVDGSRPGGRTCDSRRHFQDFGPRDPDTNKPGGRNGVEVFKASGDTVENLTACNFLSGTGTTENGNEIWFNGGDGSGKIGMRGFRGAYLNATSTYFAAQDKPMGLYGIFTSNERGPGIIIHSYASNMGDSAYYFGACPLCNVTLDDGHGYHSAQGMSLSDAGAGVLITHTEFADNKMGIIPNSLNNDDGPWNQNGACRPGSRVNFGNGSCFVIEHNYIHDNNNPNVPSIGIAANAPVGTGIELSGSQFDTVFANRIQNEGAWGILVNLFPDQRKHIPSFDHCLGGTFSGGLCLYDAFGNDVRNNVFTRNGFFGNPSNGDIGEATNPHNPGNCFRGNRNTGGALTTDPANLQQTQSRCSGLSAGDTGVLLQQGICDAELVGPCPPSQGHYPRTTNVRLLALPRHEPNMPNPCAGVPANPWCVVVRHQRAQR